MSTERTRQRRRDGQSQRQSGRWPPTTMSDLPTLLLASLSPATRKQAEQNLYTLSTDPGFLALLLQLILSSSQDRPARLAGSVFLKNIVRKRWEDVRSTPPRLPFGLKILIGCLGGTSYTGEREGPTPIAARPGDDRALCPCRQVSSRPGRRNGVYNREVRLPRAVGESG